MTTALLLIAVVAAPALDRPRLVWAQPKAVDAVFDAAKAGQPHFHSQKQWARKKVVDRPRLVRAFAIVESGDRNVPPYRDGPSQSWGYFAFKRPRWAECGGKASDWGKAGKAEQYRVMGLAVDRYLRTMPKGVDPIAFAGTRHNGGRYRGETTYTKKLRAAYLKIP